MRFRLAKTTILLALGAPFLARTSADAQDTGRRRTVWWVPAAFAGGLVGAGVGYAIDVAAWSSRNDLGGPTLIGTTAGIVVGALIGGRAGASADGRLARGDTLSSATRKTLRIATFLAPVALGSAITFAVINPSENELDPNYDPPALSDEMVVILGIGGGIIAGWWAQSHYAPALWPSRNVGIAPSRGGATFSLRFQW